MKKYLCIIPLFLHLFSYGQYDPSLWEVHDQTTSVRALSGLFPSNGYDSEVTQVIAHGAGSKFLFDWNDNSDTTYKYKWTNNNSDVLQIDFTNNNINNYNNISLFTIHWEDLLETGTTNRFIRDTNGVEQDHLSAFGYSVDFSDPTNRIVSFKVQADQDVNIRIDLIDINGKLSNWNYTDVNIENTTGGVDITNETKWETVVFSWDPSKQSEANAYSDEISDAYSSYWWDFNLNIYNNNAFHEIGTPILLDTNKIVGIAITLDQADFGILGDEKTVYIKDLQIGAGNEAENFSPDSSLFSGLVYNYSDSAPYTAEILHANVSGDFEIPATTSKDGITYSVTRIQDNAFSNCGDLTAITIPSTITNIAFRSFEDMENLKSISYSGTESFDLYLGNLEYAELPAHMFNSNLIPFDTIPDLQKVIVTNGELTSQGFDNIRKAYRSLSYVDLYNSSNTVLPDFALENCYLVLARKPKNPYKSINYC